MNRSVRLAAVVLAACAGLEAGTILNFDDQPTASSGISGIALTNQYASQGVLFSSMDASQSFKFNISPTSGSNYATAFFGLANPGLIKFVDPANSAQDGFVSQVSFTLLGLISTVAHPGQFSGATIDALDLNGNVIAGQTQIINATSLTTPNTVLSFTGQVHELRFTQTAGTSGLLPIDDLSFGPVVAPEPGTWVLFGSGLLLAGCIRRKVATR